MLYLRIFTFKASPKAISGRTSYLRVRLDFPPLSTCPLSFTRWFGSSNSLYFYFLLNHVNVSAVFGWLQQNAPPLFIGLGTAANLWFLYFSIFGVSYRGALFILRLCSRSSRLHRVEGGVLFHSPPGFFSPFPHGTCTLSVTREYLALGVVPLLPTRFLVPRGTLEYV